MAKTQQYLTVNEFAKLTGRRVNNVYQCMNDDNRKEKLPFIRVNGKAVIDKKYVAAFTYVSKDAFTEEMEIKLYALERSVHMILKVLAKYIDKELKFKKESADAIQD